MSLIKVNAPGLKGAMNYRHDSANIVKYCYCRNIDLATFCKRPSLHTDVDDSKANLSYNMKVLHSLLFLDLLCPVKSIALTPDQPIIYTQGVNTK